MKFYQDEKKGIKIILLSGKIAGGMEMQEMCEQIKKGVTKNKNKILLDFRNVRWINSAGIGGIIGCLTTLRKKGGDIRFVNLSGAAKHYFQLTKIDTVVQVYKNLDEAIEQFSIAPT